METTHKKTSRKTQVLMGSRCQERHEEDETHKMDKTSPRSLQKERNCWEGQDSNRVVAPSKKKRRHCSRPYLMEPVSVSFAWEVKLFVTVPLRKLTICVLQCLEITLCITGLVCSYNHINPDVLCRLVTKTKVLTICHQFRHLLQV